MGEEVVLIASTSSTTAMDNTPVRENNATIYEMMLNDADDTNFTSDEIVGDFFKELHDDGSSKSGINNIVDEFYKESHEQRPSSFAPRHQVFPFNLSYCTPSCPMTEKKVRLPLKLKPVTGVHSMKFDKPIDRLQLYLSLE